MIRCAMRRQLDQSPSWDSHETHTTSVVTLEAGQIGPLKVRLLQRYVWDIPGPV